MKPKVEEKLKAVRLRKRGYSLNEIVEKIGVAKSSISLWVRNITLTSRARKRLLTKIKLGQLAVAENKRKRTRETINSYRLKASKEVNLAWINKKISKIICSLLYWCEGAKSLYRGVDFTNSDPELIKTFIYLLRNSFNLDENKFRVCVHLHHYHDIEKQLKFWSGITRIPRNQFIKPFLKKNTGKIIRKSYEGCVSIRYHDTALGRQLLMTAKAFLSRYN